MMAANGATVIALQPLASRWLQRRSVLLSSMASTGIMAVASVLDGLVSTPLGWVTNHVFLTVGEVISSPI